MLSSLITSSPPTTTTKQGFSIDQIIGNKKILEGREMTDITIIKCSYKKHLLLAAANEHYNNGFSLMQAHI